MEKLVGSLNNRIMERIEDKKELKVGEGATIIMYSDRIACTVIKIISKCKALIQRDNAVRVDKFGAFSEEQHYEYSRDNEGAIFEIYCRNGVWKVKDSKERVLIGVRKEYYDYTF